MLFYPTEMWTTSHGVSRLFFAIHDNTQQHDYRFPSVCHRTHRGLSREPQHRRYRHGQWRRWQPERTTTACSDPFRFCPTTVSMILRCVLRSEGNRGVEIIKIIFCTSVHVESRGVHVQHSVACKNVSMGMRVCVCVCSLMSVCAYIRPYTMFSK